VVRHVFFAALSVHDLLQILNQRVVKMGQIDDGTIKDFKAPPLRRNLILREIVARFKLLEDIRSHFLLPIRIVSVVIGLDTITVLRELPLAVNNPWLIFGAHLLHILKLVPI